MIYDIYIYIYYIYTYEYDIHDSENKPQLDKVSFTRKASLLKFLFYCVFIYFDFLIKTC